MQEEISSMKTAILPRSDFRSAVAFADLVVERRNTIPILSNVLLRAAADGDGLELIGTDLDIEVTARIPGAVDEGFAVTMPSRALKDLEKKSPKGKAGDEFAIDAPEGDDTNARLDFGGYSARLQTLPPADFPHMELSGKVVDFVMPAATLRNALERVTFAISTEETRYYLNGIFMHVPDAPAGAPSVLRFVATDGHRLARHEAPCPAGAGGIAGVIIPRKTVGVLHKLLKAKGAPEDVHVRVNTCKAVFTIGNIAVMTKLIDGTFPDYQRVIPSGNDKRATFDREELARAIDCVSTVSSERGRAVKFSISEGICNLTVSNPDAGDSRATIPCDGWDSWGLDIGFNAQYVLHILAASGGERVTMRFSDSGSPTLISNPDAPETVFVLMPMRV